MRIHILLVALAFCLSSALHAADIPARDRIVILVTIDGFPAWIWRDTALVAPTLRKLAAGGALGTMKTANPTVTWPNHTTLVTGVPAAKHGVLFNGMLTREGPGKPYKFEQWRDKREMVRVPTIYDAAFNAGLSTAQIDWVAIHNPGTITWEFTERSDPRGKIEQELVAAGLATQEDIDNFGKRNIVFRDEVWTRAGEYIVAKHHPNFLLFHLLTTDSSNHKYGPGTLASFSAYALADTAILRLLNALDAAGMKDKFTLIVTTDHGFKTAQRIIRTDPLLRKEGLLKRAGATVTSCDVIAKSSGGSTMLYITDPAKKAELTARMKGVLETLEGVAKVYEPPEYAALGLPQPSENEQAGDLLVFAKPSYAFNDVVTESDVVVDVASDPTLYPGHHGYPSDDPQLDGIFIAYGYGIKRGTAIDSMTNLSVAPTLARLLEVKLPDAEGKALEAILELPPAR